MLPPPNFMINMTQSCKNHILGICQAQTCLSDRRIVLWLIGVQVLFSLILGRVLMLFAPLQTKTIVSKCNHWLVGHTLTMIPRTNTSQGIVLSLASVSDHMQKFVMVANADWLFALTTHVRVCWSQPVRFFFFFCYHVIGGIPQFWLLCFAIMLVTVDWACAML